MGKRKPTEVPGQKKLTSFYKVEASSGAVSGVGQAAQPVSPRPSPAKSLSCTANVQTTLFATSPRQRAAPTASILRQRAEPTDGPGGRQPPGTQSRWVSGHPTASVPFRFKIERFNAELSPTGPQGTVGVSYTGSGENLSGLAPSTQLRWSAELLGMADAGDLDAACNRYQRIMGALAPPAVDSFGHGPGLGGGSAIPAATEASAPATPLDYTHSCALEATLEPVNTSPAIGAWYSVHAAQDQGVKPAVTPETPGGLCPGPTPSVLQHQPTAGAGQMTPSASAPAALQPWRPLAPSLGPSAEGPEPAPGSAVATPPTGFFTSHASAPHDMTPRRRDGAAGCSASCGSGAGPGQSGPPGPYAVGGQHCRPHAVAPGPTQLSWLGRGPTQMLACVGSMQQAAQRQEAGRPQPPPPAGSHNWQPQGQVPGPASNHGWPAAGQAAWAPGAGCPGSGGQFATPPCLQQDWRPQGQQAPLQTSEARWQDSDPGVVAAAGPASHGPQQGCGPGKGHGGLPSIPGAKTGAHAPGPGQPWPTPPSASPDHWMGGQAVGPTNYPTSRMSQLGWAARPPDQALPGGPRAPSPGLAQAPGPYDQALGRPPIEQGNPDFVMGWARAGAGQGQQRQQGPRAPSPIPNQQSWPQAKGPGPISGHGPCNQAPSSGPGPGHPLQLGPGAPSLEPSQHTNPLNQVPGLPSGPGGLCPDPHWVAGVGGCWQQGPRAPSPVPNQQSWPQTQGPGPISGHGPCNQAPSSGPGPGHPVQLRPRAPSLEPSQHTNPLNQVPGLPSGPGAACPAPHWAAGAGGRGQQGPRAPSPGPMLGCWQQGQQHGPTGCPDKASRGQGFAAGAGTGLPSRAGSRTPSHGPRQTSSCHDIELSGRDGPRPPSGWGTGAGWLIQPGPRAPSPGLTGSSWPQNQGQGPGSCQGRPDPVLGPVLAPLLEGQAGQPAHPPGPAQIPDPQRQAAGTASGSRWPGPPSTWAAGTGGQSQAATPAQPQSWEQHGQGPHGQRPAGAVYGRDGHNPALGWAASTGGQGQGGPRPFPLGPAQGAWHQGQGFDPLTAPNPAVSPAAGIGGQPGQRAPSPQPLQNLPPQRQMSEPPNGPGGLCPDPHWAAGAGGRWQQGPQAPSPVPNQQSWPQAQVPGPISGHGPCNQAPSSGPGPGHPVQPGFRAPSLEPSQHTNPLNQVPGLPSGPGGPCSEPWTAGVGGRWQQGPRAPSPVPTQGGWQQGRGPECNQAPGGPRPGVPQGSCPQVAPPMQAAQPYTGGPGSVECPPSHGAPSRRPSPASQGLSSWSREAIGPGVRTAATRTAAVPREGRTVSTQQEDAAAPAAAAAGAPGQGAPSATQSQHLMFQPVGFRPFFACSGADASSMATQSALVAAPRAAEAFVIKTEPGIGTGWTQAGPSGGSATTGPAAAPLRYGPLAGSMQPAPVAASFGPRPLAVKVDPVAAASPLGQEPVAAAAAAAARLRPPAHVGVTSETLQVSAEQAGPGTSAGAFTEPARTAKDVSWIANLNDAQREAVTGDPERPLLIVAGAGTGKTTTLIKRVLYLMKVQGVAPRNILVITFTNKAAAEVRERLAHAGVDPRGLVASTFHSWCYSILRLYHKAAGFAQCPTVWTEPDLKRAMSLAIRLESIETGADDMRHWLGLPFDASWRAILDAASAAHPDVCQRCEEEARQLDSAQQKLKRKATKANEACARQAAGRGRGAKSRKTAAGSGPAAPTTGRTGGRAAPIGRAGAAAASITGAAAGGNGGAGGGGGEATSAGGKDGVGLAAARPEVEERMAFRADYLTALYQALWEIKEKEKRAAAAAAVAAKRELEKRPEQSPRQQQPQPQPVPAKAPKLGEKPALKQIKMELHWIDVLKRSGDGRIRDFDHGKQILYSAYEKILRDANAVDFNDMILLVTKLLRRPNSWILRRLRSRHKYILVDEYQDCSTLQVELVQLLSGNSASITAVGDDAQSIYRFRGAVPNVFSAFRGLHEHSGLQETHLELNYRSRPKILAVGAQVLKDSNGADAAGVTPKELRPVKENTATPVVFVEASTPADEAEAVAEEVARLGQEEGVQWSEVAVLFRCFKLGGFKTHTPLQSALRHRGIPFVLVRDRSIFERKEVQDVLAYLRLALNPADDAAFTRVFNTPPRRLGAAKGPFMGLLLDLQESLDRRRQAPRRRRAAELEAEAWPTQRPPEHSLYGLCGALLQGFTGGGGGGGGGGDVAGGWDGSAVDVLPSEVQALLGERELTAAQRKGMTSLVELIETLRREVWQLGPAGAVARVLELTSYVAWWASQKANKERQAKEAAEELSPRGLAAASPAAAAKTLRAQDLEVDTEGEKDEEEQQQQHAAAAGQGPQGGTRPPGHDAAEPSTPRARRLTAARRKGGDDEEHADEEAGDDEEDDDDVDEEEEEGEGVAAFGEEGAEPLPPGLGAEPKQLSQEATKVRGLRCLFKEAQLFVSRWRLPSEAVWLPTDEAAPPPPSVAAQSPQGVAGQDAGRGQQQQPGYRPAGQIPQQQQQQTPQQQQPQQQQQQPATGGDEAGGSCASPQVPELFQIAARAVLSSMRGEDVQAALRLVCPRTGLPLMVPHVLEQVYAEHRRGPLVLRDFLAHISLSDSEMVAGGRNSSATAAGHMRRQAVTISTIHAAKGLEWPVVFVARWCQGYLPTVPRLDAETKRRIKYLSPSEVALLEEEEAMQHEQEERRLAHVAVTRAMERLYITAIRVHCVQGKSFLVAPSTIQLPPPEAGVVERRELPRSKEELWLMAEAVALRPAGGPDGEPEDGL